MEVTVKITRKMIREVRAEVHDFTGRTPTDHELEKFFRKDVRFVYTAAFEDGLADGIQAHFG